MVQETQQSSLYTTRQEDNMTQEYILDNTRIIKRYYIEEGRDLNEIRARERRQRTPYGCIQY